MKSIETYDGVDDIFHDEEGDIHDNLVSDVRNLLLT